MNEQIIEAVTSWMFKNKYNHYDKFFWGNEYSEYYLNENDFGVLVLLKYNLEIHSELIWQVPIQTVNEFAELMKILEP